MNNEKNLSVYAVEGTPADCIKWAVSESGFKPDWIVSGVNRGANTGISLFYSGTVAAAREGAINGIPSLAVSLCSKTFEDFSPATEWTAKLLNYLGKRSETEPLLLNLSIPPCVLNEIRGLKLAKQAPSRFIEEINDEFLEYINPMDNRGYTYKPTIDLDIFGDIDKSKLRLAKPIAGTPPKKYGEESIASSGIRKLKPVGNAPSSNSNLFDSKLTVGNIVMHERFGKGEILNLEGIGADKKAEIKFEVGGIKKLLLRFAKLDVIG